MEQAAQATTQEVTVADSDEDLYEGIRRIHNAASAAYGSAFRKTMGGGDRRAEDDSHDLKPEHVDFMRKNDMAGAYRMPRPMIMDTIPARYRAPEHGSTYNTAGESTTRMGKLRDEVEKIHSQHSQEMREHFEKHGRRYDE